MELLKILQSQGFGSRKQCLQRIEFGTVSVAGQVLYDAKAQVDTTDLTFEVEGVPWLFREKAYLVMNKPTGYECSHKPNHYPSVFSLLPLPLLERDVQCVGRLDQDTTGLLLFSDDGQFIHTQSSGKKGIPKTYRITLSSPHTPEQIAQLLSGVKLIDEPEPIAAQSCVAVTAQVLDMAITTGKYHQVKRMITAAGNHVAALERIAIGGLSSEHVGLEVGEWRWLEAIDLTKIFCKETSAKGTENV